jgi:hypothetical protein
LAFRLEFWGGYGPFLCKMKRPPFKRVASYLDDIDRGFRISEWCEALEINPATKGNPNCSKSSAPGCPHARFDWTAAGR